jgi:hypothetical protein
LILMVLKIDSSPSITLACCEASSNLQSEVLKQIKMYNP